MKTRLLAAVCVAASLLVAPLAAQVGKSQGVVDVNTASEADLSKMPHMTPAIAKALAAKRPFMTLTELNAFLLSQGLTQEQAMALYEKGIVHINLNTASREEIMLVPGAGKRMAREFDEYRPWKSYAQFDKEIGKYVSADAVAKLAQYTFIPMNANTASDEHLMTIPGADQALVAKIKKGRPYKARTDLEAVVGKANARFFVVE